MTHKRFLVLPVFLTGALLLSGCGATQVRDRAYVQGIELSRIAEPTVHLHDFSAESAVSSGTGSTLETALEQAAIPLGKALFLGHLELIAYHEAAFSGTLDSLMTQYRLSPSCHVLLLPAGTVLDDTDTSQLGEQLRRAEENGVLPETNLFGILREMDSTSQTALVPMVTSDGFTAAILTPKTRRSILSADAAAGLCWIRGDNFHAQIATADQQTYRIQSASTRLAAAAHGDHADITVQIQLRGEGDFSAAQERIAALCSTAIDESVRQAQADVLGLEACLRSQCHRFYTSHDWSEVLSALEFHIQIQERN